LSLSCYVCCPGYIDVYVGGQQPNQATTLESNVLHGEIYISHSTVDIYPAERRNRMLRVEVWDISDHDTVMKL